MSERLSPMGEQIAARDRIIAQKDDLLRAERERVERLEELLLWAVDWYDVEFANHPDFSAAVSMWRKKAGDVLKEAGP